MSRLVCLGKGGGGVQLLPLVRRELLTDETQKQTHSQLFKNELV